MNLSISSFGVFAEECSSFLDTLNDIGIVANHQIYCITKFRLLVFVPRIIFSAAGIMNGKAGFTAILKYLTFKTFYIRYIYFCVNALRTYIIFCCCSRSYSSVADCKLH